LRDRELLRNFLLLAVVLTAASLLFSSGCKSTEAAPSQQELQKLVSDAVVAGGQASTYKVDLNMTMAIKASSGNETNQGEFTTIIKSENDRSARKSHVNFYMSSVITSGGRPSSSNLSIEMYVFPDFMYAKRTTQWTKQPYREEAVTPGANELDQHLALLKSVYDLKFLRYETLDSSDYYVVEMTPDSVLATSWFLKHSIFGVDSDPDKESKNLKRITYTAWIDKKTMLLKKVDLVFGFEMDAQTPDADTADVNMTMNINDYNIPLSIALPPEATDTLQPPPNMLPKP